ncbi:MAG: helix-turn-helix domain-containing protein [Bacteroidota bacterium]
MGNYNVTDIFLLLGIGQGLFLSFSLLLIHKRNVAANKILALQLFLSGLILLTRMLLHKADEFWIIQRLAPLESLIFVLGPLGFTYFKRLFEKGQSNFMVNRLHYLPALAYLTFLLYLGSYSNQEFGQKLISGDFNFPFLIAEVTGICFNLYYWFLSFHFIRTIQKKAKEQFSFNQTMIAYAKILLVASGIILTAWAFGFLNMYVLKVKIPTITYNMVWISVPILIYIVGFFAIKQPEIFRIVLQEKSKAKLRKLLDDKSIEDLKRRLEKLMIHEKIYLDNELTLVHLSKELNTSTNNLSWLLNTIYRTNFYDFVNEYRIKEFIVKLEHNEHKAKTLLSLSMEVGFNSKSTFNKAFKSALNETPSSYIKRLAS